MTKSNYSENHSFQLRKSHSGRTVQFVFNHDVESKRCLRLQLKNDGNLYLTSTADYFCEHLCHQFSNSKELLEQIDEFLPRIKDEYKIFYITHIGSEKNGAIVFLSTASFFINEFFEVKPVRYIKTIEILENSDNKIFFNTFKEAFASNVFVSGSNTLEDI